jgi:hypothetical protein
MAVQNSKLEIGKSKMEGTEMTRYTDHPNAAVRGGADGAKPKVGIGKSKMEETGMTG